MASIKRWTGSSWAVVAEVTAAELALKANQSALDSHTGATSAHSATSAPTASRIIIRDTAARAQVAAPSAAADIARLDTVTGSISTHDSSGTAHSDIRTIITNHAAETAPHSATAAPTASRIILRDAAGRAQVATPSAAADIVRKDYADALGVSVATANTIMRRDAAGRAQVAAPSAAADIARKDTVDAHANLTNNPHSVTAAQVGADPSGTASSAVSTHNSSGTAHTDIRNLIALKADKAGDTFTGNIIAPNVQLDSTTLGTTGTIAIDFAGAGYRTQSALTGNITYTSSNLAVGRTVTIRVTNGTTLRTLAFPAGWRFVSEKPTDIAANKVGILTVTSFGTTDADCVAAWAVEE